jgi:NAD(P)-dependent dehydrogenase (short-subunit alcohol dehydrogenase family)
MSRTGQKVAIITGGSQGIGASLVAAYRRQGWSVVATARTMKPTGDPGRSCTSTAARSPVTESCARRTGR